MSDFGYLFVQGEKLAIVKEQRWHFGSAWADDIAVAFDTSDGRHWFADNCDTVEVSESVVGREVTWGDFGYEVDGRPIQEICLM